MTPCFQYNSREEYDIAYNKSVTDPEGFWNEVAEQFKWKKKWNNVLSWNFTEPNVKWFEGAKLNITENCLDRHLEKHGEQPAILWEPNHMDESSIQWTYNELYSRVVKFSQVLRNIGIKKGDRVCIYMGMIPELAVAVLACARIGAVHSVIFGGFSAMSIKDRIIDAHAEFVITCDGAYRGDKCIPLKDTVDEAIQEIPWIKNVVVFERTKQNIQWTKSRDRWWHEEENKLTNEISVDAESMDAEDLLFILYTSGSTGKPKGVVHTCGGYMVWTAYTFSNVFQYKDNEIHYCTADVGWITGHSYIIYGPLLNGATTVMFEGIPTWPDAGRFWDIVDKYRVNIFYTAPTAIRTLMTYGTEFIKNKSLASLRVLGTVGEPINEEAWKWYDVNIGKSKCPIVDTYWQTETGGIMISNSAGITESRAAWATLPLPGVMPILLADDGTPILKTDEAGNKSGNLCFRFPWPGILRSTYGDHERCRKNYFATFENSYFTGDGAILDSSGFYRITGRVDDVLNVSGHRLGTAEIENAMNTHPLVIESAVVGYTHEIKGQGIYAFIILQSHQEEKGMLEDEIKKTVIKIIGVIARPDKIQFVPALPKTRSGKIMRRILRKIADRDFDNFGDISTLLDPSVVDEIKKNAL